MQIDELGIPASPLYLHCHKCCSPQGVDSLAYVCYYSTQNSEFIQVTIGKKSGAIKKHTNFTIYSQVPPVGNGKITVMILLISMQR